MCGIAGIIAKESDTLANDLVKMLKQIPHRGTDATGIAVYEERDEIQIRVALTNSKYQKDLEEIVRKYGAISNSRAYSGVGVFTFFEASLAMSLEKIEPLNWAIDTHPQLCVHSLGQHIKVYKDQGSADDLKKCHKIDVGTCSHGIGHVRLATESVEDVNAAHPFISYLQPNLSIVHNGQFTNYFNIRRALESKGVRFTTNNDTEMATHFIAYQMKENGQDLEGALNVALDAFDGIFTILAATEDQIGAVRDRLAFKPLLIYESENGMVVFASEQIAIAPIVSDVYATEMDPGGVKIWSI